MAGQKVEKILFDYLAEVAHSKNVRDFINSILRVRAITSPPLIKLGIDGGGSFFKFSLSVISNGAIQNVKKSSASNDKSLLTVEDGQETSVKHQVHIAVAENVLET